MSNAKPTPRPWSVAVNQIMAQGQSLHIAGVMECYEPGQQQANAAFIVHAVNLHDELVAMLAAASAAEDVIAPNSDLACDLRALLAKARTGGGG